jgi:hypothetical protein
LYFNTPDIDSAQTSQKTPLLIQRLYQMKIYGKLENKTSYNPDKEEKMVVDWSYPKEAHWIHREVDIDWNPQGGSKARQSRNTWKRTSG